MGAGRPSCRACCLPCVRIHVLPNTDVMCDAAATACSTGFELIDGKDATLFKCGKDQVVSKDKTCKADKCVEAVDKATCCVQAPGTPFCPFSCTVDPCVSLLVWCCSAGRSTRGREYMTEGGRETATPSEVVRLVGR